PSPLPSRFLALDGLLALKREISTLGLVAPALGSRGRCLQSEGLVRLHSSVLARVLSLGSICSSLLSLAHLGDHGLGGRDRDGADEHS
ncbi:hypothetical protein PMAYCL1PPCAC_24554, partial [Pristionchus mayeri]